MSSKCQQCYNEGRGVKNPQNSVNVIYGCPLVPQFLQIAFYSIQGMFFWDYGNAFLLEARRAGADVSPKSNGGPQEDGLNEEATAFRYPSYVQDIMG